MLVYIHLQASAMVFQKKNEYCSKPLGDKALDPRPLCFRVDSEIKEQLMAIPDWQKKLRAVLPSLISEWKE